ncbi:DUF6107 family protein [Aureimonas sp. ME7]|uniref:DUF6107 family protein n=1 Tax=Aureimonas sp. ME7 TaxID=2744252 RepID=UPI0032AEB9E4
MAGDVASPLALFGAKLAGAIGGSVVSIAYLLPSGRREAAARFLTGAVTGLVFGGPAGLALAEHLDLAGRIGAAELALMGSAAVSLCAWWALGAGQRFTDGLFSVAALKRSVGR